MYWYEIILYHTVLLAALVGARRCALGYAHVFSVLNTCTYTYVCVWRYAPLVARAYVPLWLCALAQTLARAPMRLHVWAQATGQPHMCHLDLYGSICVTRLDLLYVQRISLGYLIIINHFYILSPI